MLYGHDYTGTSSQFSGKSNLLMLRPFVFDVWQYSVSLLLAANIMLFIREFYHYLSIRLLKVLFGPVIIY